MSPVCGPVIFVWFIIYSTFTPRFWRTAASGIVIPFGNPRQPILTKILPHKPTLRNPTGRLWSYWVGCDHEGTMALDLRHILPNVVITRCQCNRSYCTHRHHLLDFPAAAGALAPTSVWQSRLRANVTDHVVYVPCKGYVGIAFAGCVLSG